MVAAGCGGGGQAQPAAASYTLDDGTIVEVGGDGSVALFQEQHGLMSIAPGGPETATFDVSWQSLFGMWSFDRPDETRQRFGRFVGSEATATGVQVRYQSADNAAASIDVELVDGELRLRVQSDAPYDSIAIPLRCDDASSFHGWGEQYNASDQRGAQFDLFVQEQGLGREGTPDSLTPAGHEHTTYYPMPYFVDARGFGMLVETDNRTLVDLCNSDPDVAWIEVEASAPLAAVVLPGPTPADVVMQLGDQVGRPVAPPSWAYQLWVGSQGGRDAVLAEVDALEAAGVPVGTFWVQDWTGPRTNAGGGSGVQYRWVADDAHYPDLAGLVAELHQRGYHFLSYVNPFVMPDLPDHFDAMDSQGLLIMDDDGQTLLHPSPAGDASHPDLTNEASRDYVKSFLRDMVDDLGMDGWMADFGEWVPPEAVLSDGGDALAYHNRYPEAWHRLSREVMDELRPSGDWVVFTRSGWTGQQSVAQVVWCGDQEATFAAGDGLPTVVRCMLSLGLSGVPHVTHDIAGFSGGPSSKELYLRWIELGAFTPIMRTHEGNEKDANWSWEKDQQTTDQLRRFAMIHDVLAPEIDALAQQAAQTSMPIVRHLMLEFPDDAASLAVDDQYMLGPDLLVAPVVEQGVTERDVYLPPGAWFHVWSGTEHQGGELITIDAPIGQPPVFSRGGDRTDLRAVQ